MKILAIRGKNLASLEDEFVIDFATEPLKSAGIFAITGNTGAGKSTILDALCLALFDNTPRTSNASENIQISDVLDKTIYQKDSRNILRRGTVDGYAEVDFTALNGHDYRSRWSVRRANNKQDGALQKTEIKLKNLSVSTEEQGTKKDLLNKITELIGLSFEQFTRAVLLAQGDFATFLKAKQGEKAELLEKLTGTEIYSRISATIFRKAKDAERDFLLIQQRIKDVKLLTPEELEALNQDKTSCEKELEPVRKLIDTTNKNLSWIKQEESLKQDISDTDNKLKAIQRDVLDAASRYEYISMIDTSQEIRDTYLDLAGKKKQLTVSEENFRNKETELKNIILQLGEANKELQNIKAILDENEKAHSSIKPDITKAKELDIKIVSLKEKSDESQKELEYQKKQKQQSEQNINHIETQIQEIKKAIESTTSWFTERDRYKEIIPRTDLIITLLNDAENTKKQNQAATKSLNSNNDILKTYTDKLELLNKEAERLNRLLPSEVLNLREQLEEGKPCPVCGSLHHPIFNSDAHSQDTSVNERELEQEKKRLNELIANTQQSLDNTKKEITQLETLTKNYQSQYESAIQKVEGYLLDFPNWKGKQEEGNLQSKLSEFAALWNKNKENLEVNKLTLESLIVKLESENKVSTSIIAELKRKEEIFNQNAVILQTISDERKLLLDGKNASEVETFYNNLNEEYSRKHETLRIEKEKKENEQARINGIIQQIKKDIKTNLQEQDKLQLDVDNWLSKKNHQITKDILADLVSKSHEWIAQEKNALTSLKNQEISLSATLKERVSRLEKHNLSEDKPENTDRKQLNETLLSSEAKEKELKQQLTQIEVSLATHKAGEEKIKAFEKELNEKSELCDNWQKLNVLLGSADGTKFKTIAQGYTLDILLGYANKHLEDLTKRYKLEKIADTLALQVVDNDMLGEVRTVHSLSGGESFLISLSLALGLSSLSSNRMKIESLFIDEGFGSLDIDTLSIAMDALENLQTQGRKIGVISHVEEMTERISVQVQVIRSANGRSIVRVIGK